MCGCNSLLNTSISSRQPGICQCFLSLFESRRQLCSLPLLALIIGPTFDTSFLATTIAARCSCTHRPHKTMIMLSSWSSASNGTTMDCSSSFSRSSIKATKAPQREAASAPSRAAADSRHSVRSPGAAGSKPSWAQQGWIVTPLPHHTPHKIPHARACTTC